MLTPDQYTEAVRRRLHGTRARVMEDQQVGPGRVLVGIRSENVMLTPVSTYVVVARTEFATGAMLRDFCRHADAYARRLAGGGVGWVSGACTIAAVVAGGADHDAQQFAGQQAQVGWGTTLRPVVVDLGSGNVVTNLSTGFVGALAVNSVNENVRRYFPLPAEAYAELGHARGGAPGRGPSAPHPHQTPHQTRPPHGAPPPHAPQPPPPPPDGYRRY
ncbi:hypothetical protein [Actinorugispora endophytica]|uniref:Uncharacterized protein n=1 Tax=Actinorugispora endophytica TaxID=1605990 RepID=A0A4R6V405_9ACTN|nr:hypothetical protein [Actinorugispora endophytica]TDQ52929.1 hypothetical protein EV190_10546 [Actinorugispora endophytica]